MVRPENIDSLEIQFHLKTHISNPSQSIYSNLPEFCFLRICDLPASPHLHSPKEEVMGDAPPPVGAQHPNAENWVNVREVHGICKWVFLILCTCCVHCPQCAHCPLENQHLLREMEVPWLLVEPFREFWEKEYWLPSDQLSTSKFLIGQMLKWRDVVLDDKSSFPICRELWNIPRPAIKCKAPTFYKCWTLSKTGHLKILS